MYKFPFEALKVVKGYVLHVLMSLSRCVLLQHGQVPREPEQAQAAGQHAEADKQTHLAKPLHARPEGTKRKD